MNAKELVPGNEYYYTSSEDWEIVIYQHETINGYKFAQGNTEAILTQMDVEHYIEKKSVLTIMPIEDTNNEKYNIDSRACDWDCKIKRDGSIRIWMEDVRVSVYVEAQTCIAKVYKHAHLKIQKDVSSMNPMAFNGWLMSLKMSFLNNININDNGYEYTC